MVAFVWGALLFGELDAFSAAQIGALVVAFFAVVAGVLLIATSQGHSVEASDSTAPGWRRLALQPDESTPEPASCGWPRPACCGAATLCRPSGPTSLPRWAISHLRTVVLGRRAATQQLGAGVLFGVGNLALLAVVAKLGTGVGFTIAQLSLAVNASIIWIFRRPAPGTRQARRVSSGS